MKNPIDLGRRYGQLMVMTNVPEGAMEREDIGDQMWAWTLWKFGENLPPGDRSSWDNLPQNRREYSREQDRLARVFDDFLLEELRTYWGWRLLMSRGVLARLAEWEQDSPHLLRRLGEELESKSKYFRGEASIPIVGDLYGLKRKVIPELRVLLTKMKANFRNRRLPASLPEIASWIDEQIKGNAGTFPLLHQNLLQLLGFINNLMRIDDGAAHDLAVGKLRPEEFFYRFYAAATNRTPESVRREMYRRRRPGLEKV